MLKHRRITALVLLFSLLLPCFASCAEDTEEAQASAADDTSIDEEIAAVEEEEEETGIRSLSSVPDNLDYEGFEFVINCRQTNDCVDTDEMTGEVVNDAIYTRNQMAEEYFNITISQLLDVDTSCGQTQTAIIAGDNSISACCTHITQMCSMAQNGYFYNLDNVEYLDVSQPYWTQSVTDSLAINGKRYLFCGDISITDNTNIWCIYFNKNIIEDLGLESPYVALDEGRWTLDYFASQAEQGSMDLDGDGAWSWDTDRFAVLNPTETLCGMYNSMGCLSVTRNDDGTMRYSLGDEESVNVLMKISEWATTGAGTTFLEASQINTGDQWGDLWRTFAAGRGLYYIHVIDTILENLRDMDDEFGILPMPKYDEKQENYISSTQEWGQTVYAVPLCTKDAAMTGAVLEYMGGLSTDTVRASYYDVALTRKYSRDNESVVSLDILFNNVVIDLGFSYLSIRSSVSSALSAGTISSTLKSSQKVSEKQIEKLEKTFAELQ